MWWMIERLFNWASFQGLELKKMLPISSQQAKWVICRKAI